METSGRDMPSSSRQKAGLNLELEVDLPKRGVVMRSSTRVKLVITVWDMVIGRWNVQC